MSLFCEIRPTPLAAFSLDYCAGMAIARAGGMKGGLGKVALWLVCLGTLATWACSDDKDSSTSGSSGDGHAGAGKTCANIALHRTPPVSAAACSRMSCTSTAIRTSRRALQMCSGTRREGVQTEYWLIIR